MESAFFNDPPGLVVKGVVTDDEKVKFSFPEKIADDGFDGPIQDIQIDGVFGCHSLRGVRLLSTKSPQIEPKNVKDFFALMKNDIENLKNGSLAK